MSGDSLIEQKISQMKETLKKLGSTQGKELPPSINSLDQSPEEQEPQHHQQKSSYEFYDQAVEMSPLNFQDVSANDISKTEDVT